MAISFGVGPSSAVSVSTSASLNVTLNGTTAGRQLVVAIQWFGGGVTVSSVACSGESNLTVHASTFEVDTGSGTTNIQLATLDNITTGGNKTITVTWSAALDADEGWASVVELVDGDANSFVANGNSASGDSSGIPPYEGSVGVTTSRDGSTVFAFMGTTYFDYDTAAGAGYTTLLEYRALPGSNIQEYDFDVGAAGAKTATANIVGSGDFWMMAALALNPSAAIPTGSVTITGYAPEVSISQVITPVTGGALLTGVSALITDRITPEAGSLTIIGRRPPPTLPILQLNGTDAVSGIDLPILQFNGTDAVGGMVLPGYELNGTDVLSGLNLPAYETPGGSAQIIPGTATLSIVGLTPGILLSQVEETPSTGALSLAGYAPDVQNSATPVLTPSTGTLSADGYSPTLAEANVIPNGADIALLYYTSDATGSNSGLLGDNDLLLHSLEASGDVGWAASADLTLLAPILEAYGNQGADTTLLTHTLEASGIQGAVQSADIDLLTHEITASGIQHGFGSAANDLLYHDLDGEGIVNQIGSLTAERGLHTLEATGHAGNTGTASISLLVHTPEFTGFADITGAAEIDLPGHYLEAIGLQTLAESYRAWVLNLRNSALTEYDNFKFNSFALFNGVYLAAGPTGIHVLGTQDADDTTDITARVRTGSVDYGSTFLKRVPRLYVTGEFPTDMYFRTVTSEDGERTYVLHTNEITGVQQRRVPIGRGPKALKWAYELENIDGGDFRVSRVMPYPQELKRRVA